VELKLNKLEKSFKYRNKFIQIVALINQKGRVGKNSRMINECINQKNKSENKTVRKWLK